jgi:hypothetical protein
MAEPSVEIKGIKFPCPERKLLSMKVECSHFVALAIAAPITPMAQVPRTCSGGRLLALLDSFTVLALASAGTLAFRAGHGQRHAWGAAPRRQRCGAEASRASALACARARVRACAHARVRVRACVCRRNAETSDRGLPWRRDGGKRCALRPSGD